MITLHKQMLPEGLAKVVWENFDSLGLTQSYWTRGELKVPFPRLTAFYSKDGTGYEYSGQETAGKVFPIVVAQIAEFLEASGHPFNSCLVNYYRDGKDSVSWHRDSEKIFVKGSEIGSVSLGSSRRFLFKHYESGERQDYVLENKDVLFFDKEHKEDWVHSVPKESEAGPRINFTFRIIG